MQRFPPAPSPAPTPRNTIHFSSDAKEWTQQVAALTAGIFSSCMFFKNPDYDNIYIVADWEEGSEFCNMSFRLATDQCMRSTIDDLGLNLVDSGLTLSFYDCILETKAKQYALRFQEFLHVDNDF